MPKIQLSAQKNRDFREPEKENPKRGAGPFLRIFEAISSRSFMRKYMNLLFVTRAITMICEFCGARG
ncbi:hypothetical protein BRCON_1207 [Candidatus Sumerlaea chitinivorans]|uniref:Uncharacterized protein n=1 Tax=Sumerlaea chitinivorans TaxID=2250252 RepID=A0A2Z4Y4B4_SUMC1|nr:hypothetical protein BRCON_1207 [Candidatus Sumerlaea chitinivorans]